MITISEIISYLEDPSDTYEVFKVEEFEMQHCVKRLFVACYKLGWHLEVTRKGDHYVVLVKK